MAGRVRIALCAMVASLVLPMAQAGADEPVPWLLPGSPPLPPDYTVPYLPAVEPVSCVEGTLSCVRQLETILQQHTAALGCDHDAVFADAYLTITRGYLESATDPDYFDDLERLDPLAVRGTYERPDRINHEVRNYAQEYLDQYARWHTGHRDEVAPSWAIAFQAADDESVTATGDLLLQLNAHIRRDNPIRAIEQTEGVLRADGPMPDATGRPDHDRISDVLQENAELMSDRLAARYDPSLNDGNELLGMVIDPKSVYLLISSWREEAWRNAEQLRHARAAGGVDGPLYHAKLAEIDASAEAAAYAILAATRTTPEANQARREYCRDNLDNGAP
ncbi:DUF5995 family protein [Haloechinothrix halophila]|uniref:DUF5995 family protein n=1 Tax=Haloechinothrix halophila TaxID=1069073 RepID=UPI00042512EB|nr:DUF5995 family protein [Haloechinothrix halophila]